MNRPGWLIGGAAVVAGAILAVAWTLGGAAPTDADRPRDAPEFNPPGDLFDGPTDADGDTNALPLRRMSRARFRSVGKDRVTVLSWDELEPRTDYVSDFTEPRAEVFFDDGRRLVIEGPAATIFHPGQDPQRGSFDRDVVVTLYEDAPEDQPDPPTDTQVMFRIFFDAETAFDRDVGQIRSDGPVFVTGPTAEFAGHGLQLTFNPVRDRIESMTIDRGDYLRLRRPAGEGAEQQEDRKHQEDQEDRTVETVDAPPTDFASAGTETDDDPPQFYRAEFADDVHVTVGTDEAELLGAALDVIFTLQDQKDTVAGRPEASREAPETPLRLALAESDAQRNATGETTDAVVLTTLAPRSLMSPQPDDVLVHWTGPLQMLPHEPNDAELVDPTDAVLALRGDEAAPAVLRQLGNTGNPSNDPSRFSPVTVTADALRYFTASRRIEAQGTPQRPLVLDDPTQGRLTGIALRLTPADAAGRVQGPGRLLAYQRRDDNEVTWVEPTSTTDADPSLALDLTFATHLDLSFDTDAAGDLSALRQAVFQGDVRALAYENDDQTQDSPLKTQDASPALDLAAETVILDLATDDAGRTRPTALTARRGVLAQQPGRSIRSDSLRAELSEAVGPRDDEEANSNAAVDDRLQLSALKATGNITVVDTIQSATLTGHRLVAAPDAGTLQLLGTDADPARVRTADADLQAPQLDFDEPTQTLRATGKGSLTSTRADDNPGAESTVMHVVWTEHLHYLGTAGTADVRGRVVATTTSPTERTRLESHRLALTFEPHPSVKPEQAQSDGVDPDADLLTLDLRSAHATPDPASPGSEVTLVAHTPDPDNPAEPLTRLTVIGPDLRLENDPTDRDAQFIAVQGAGRMMFEDYRAPEDQSRARDRNADQPLQLAGQGVTFFQWAGSLNVDLVTNDVVMLEDVRMNHDPPGGQPNVRLFGDRLTADLTEATPLAALLNAADKDASTSQGDPELRRVQLDGNVEVRQTTRRVYADQLIYVAADRNVLLQAAPGRNVRVRDPDRGNLEAEAITWNLDRDRLRVTNHRGGVLPVE